MDEINWVHRCIIVHASIVDHCRSLAAGLTPAADGMWTTALSPTGSHPATCYISSGLVDQSLADMLDSPEALAAGTGISINDAAYLLSRSDITQDGPHAAMERLNVTLISEGEA